MPREALGCPETPMDIQRRLETPRSVTKRPEVQCSLKSDLFPARGHVTCLQLCFITLIVYDKALA